MPRMIVDVGFRAAGLAGGETCAYCSKPAAGNYSIHRDGFGEGPEVPLCDTCGGKPEPTCEEIWARIAHPVEEEAR